MLNTETWCTRLSHSAILSGNPALRMFSPTFHSKGGSIQGDVWKLTRAPARRILLAARILSRNTYGGNSQVPSRRVQPEVDRASRWR